MPLDPLDRQHLVRRVCVFCGSNAGIRREYRDAARALGREMAARRIALVFGGSSIGLMGTIADAVVSAGGHVIGVIPQALVARELAHCGIPDLRVVASMHERKALMADLADAFIAMPGGFGTLEELCEVITWTQLGLHQKRCGLLNVSGFYDPFLAQVDRATREGFIPESNLSIVTAATDPGRLLTAVLEPLAPPEPKWLESPSQT